MTETQNHRRPLAPGEIRMARVGRVIFKVMHIAGGSFTQAIALRPDAPTEVIATEMFEQDAVRAYADAIEQAERAVAPSLSAVPQDRTADGVPEVEQTRPLDLSLAIAECERFEEIDRTAVARGESANWWERGAVPQRATDAQCIGMPLPVGDAVPQCGHFAAHYPHPIGESVRYRTFGDR